MSALIDSVPESHRDLLESPLTATLTTIDGRGRPQSTAVGYLIDENGELKGTVTTDRQKYKNLRGNPNCSLFIIDPANPYRTLEIRASAVLVADPTKEMVKKSARAYGADEAMLLAQPGDRVTIEFKPWRIVAQ